MWLCIACNTEFKSDLDNPVCPVCRCIGLIPIITPCSDELEIEWDKLNQQHIENLAKFEDLKDKFEALSNCIINSELPEIPEQYEHPNCNCGCTSDFSDICFGKPANDNIFNHELKPIVFSPLSFHDLDINELLLISSIDDNLVELALQAKEDEVAFNLLQPSVITEMQERFLHTFLEDCVV